jgi:hypothetical protein
MLNGNLRIDVPIIRYIDDEVSEPDFGGDGCDDGLFGIDITGKDFRPCLEHGAEGVYVVHRRDLDLTVTATVQPNGCIDILTSRDVKILENTLSMMQFDEFEAQIFQELAELLGWNSLPAECCHQPKECCCPMCRKALKIVHRGGNRRDILRCTECSWFALCGTRSPGPICKPEDQEAPIQETTAAPKPPGRKGR